MHAKKRNFLVKVFQKVLKNGIFEVFFSLPAALIFLVKIGSLGCSGSARKINLFDLQKKLSENPRSAPGQDTVNHLSN